jgi:transmembrane sensor
MNISDESLINYLTGEYTPEEARQIEEWRKAEPANEQRYQDFKLIWDTSSHLQYHGDVNATASLHELKQKVIARQQQQTKVVRLKTNFKWLAAAATILIFAVSAWFYINNRSVANVQVVTVAEVRIDTLSDGSVLTINKNTQLSFPGKFPDSQRQVFLTRGEAFFNVKHQSARPFVIHAGSTTIQVLGTTFNVKHKNGRVEVIVESGMVAVKKGEQTVFLKPGEKGVIQPDARLISKETNPDKLYAYYRSNEFVADNTPLWRMVEVLNEAYDAQIIIGRNELRDMPLNTTFKNESLDEVLKVISKTFSIRVERKEQQIILK